MYRIVLHSSSSSQLTVVEEFVQAISDAEQLPPPDSPSGVHQAKPLVHEVDLQRYRQLVKGMIPLRSSMLRANLETSQTSIQQRKSVHFSDQEGYTLSKIHIYDKPVRFIQQ